MTSAIETEALTKNFWRVEALRNISVEVPAQAIYSLVGPNGAGKTTLIKILMNIIRPSAGRAAVMGMPSTSIAGREFTAIGYVSENQELPSWMRVDRFLNYVAGFYPTWDRSRANELIKQFDLPLARKLKHLSRGMRMKAALASALAFHPKLIMLDEPFSGLDPLVRDQLIESLLEHASEATIFVSSHDQVARRNPASQLHLCFGRVHGRGRAAGLARNRGRILCRGRRISVFQFSRDCL
jgi:ABC-type multidrug transport system ATPase subunit